MRRTLLAGLAVGAALAGAARSGQAAVPLRLCADPDNLPFSTASDAATKAGAPGLYVEIGQAMADALHRPMETVWSLSYFGKRNLGATLLAGKCDFVVGQPAVEDFMGPRVIFSRPIISVGYALAVPKDSAVHGVGDLDGKRVAVQFSSPPQSFVAERDSIHPSTVMNPEEGMKLLADGKVDAAFVWGPSAGYDNHALLHDAFRILPVDGPQMSYSAAIAFAKSSKDLRDQVDAALPALAPKISALVAKYAFPNGPAVSLAAVETPAATSTQAPQPVVAQVPAEAPKPDDAASPPAQDAAAEGREIFNGTCAHCHGPDAIQSERRINLRLLKHRYGDNMHEVFHTTVTKGRPAKGMPVWEGVFTEDDFTKIYAFLSTVQDP